MIKGNEIQELIKNPSKALFEFNDWSDESKKEFDEYFYQINPKPKEQFDEYGLRYDIDYLNKLGNDIILSPVEYSSNYVDVITKSYIDNNDAEFIKYFCSDFIPENLFHTINATGIGNLAYSYIYCKDEYVKNDIKNYLIDIFVWKVKQFTGIMDALKSVN